MTEHDVAFGSEDMQLFAAASGDSSPLHTDRAFARRTPYGDCIVYGGLLTVALAGVLPAEAVAALRSLRSSFPGPVYPGEQLTVRATPHPSRPGVWELRAECRGKLAARVVADTGHAEAQASAVLGRAAADGAADYVSGAGLGALAARFGAAELHPALLDGIGWASYLVGMGAAGIQGLCAAVDLTTSTGDVPREGAPGRAWCTVTDRDARTGRHLLEGALYDGSGEARTVARIECFPVPVVQARAQ